MSSRTTTALFALAIVAGGVDLADPGLAARLALAAACHLGDMGLRTLIDRAAAVHAAGLEQNPQAVDAAYLRAVIDCVVDLLHDPVWERVEPIHARHQHDSEMMRLFELAAEAFSAAVIDAAAAVLAGPAAEMAIAKAMQSRRA